MARHSDLNLPERIARLEELATDLWWSWHPEARQVFRHLDYQVWRATAHNPVLMLREVSRERLEAAASDPAFLAEYDRAVEGLYAAHATTNTWWSRRYTHLEIPFGPFERTVEFLATVNPEGTTASYRLGFFEVVMPKQNGDGVQRVTVMLS